MRPTNYVFPPGMEPPKWPLWKKAARVICDAFEMDDHEYIRWSFEHWPVEFWLTILQPGWRYGWKRYMPWRIRFAWAGLLRKWIWSHCTLCHSRFSLRELTKSPSDLDLYMSGSICHKSCSDRKAVESQRPGACIPGTIGWDEKHRWDTFRLEE